jgi:hypothetical protein
MVGGGAVIGRVGGRVVVKPEVAGRQLEREAQEVEVVRAGQGDAALPSADVVGAEAPGAGQVPIVSGTVHALDDIVLRPSALAAFQSKPAVT